MYFLQKRRVTIESTIIIKIKTWISEHQGKFEICFTTATTHFFSYPLYKMSSTIIVSIWFDKEGYRIITNFLTKSNIIEHFLDADPKATTNWRVFLGNGQNLFAYWASWHPCYYDAWQFIFTPTFWFQKIEFCFSYFMKCF